MAEINGIFVDNIVAKQIPDIRHEVLKRDKDKHIVIDGREGSGKSMLAFQLAKALDPEFNINKIAFNGKQFEDLIKDPSRKKGDCIILDEAFGSANSRSSLSAINRAMVTLATEMRQLNLFAIIVLPSFFDLDRYFAIWRCDTLFHVYFNKDGDRGQYIIFPFDTKLKLYVDGKKTYNYNAVKSPYPPCHFNKDWVIDEEEYRKRKAEAFRIKKVYTRELKWLERFWKLVEYFHKKEGWQLKQLAEIIEIEEDNMQKCYELQLLERINERNIAINTKGSHNPDNKGEVA